MLKKAPNQFYTKVSGRLTNSAARTSVVRLILRALRPQRTDG